MSPVPPVGSAVDVEEEPDNVGRVAAIAIDAAEWWYVRQLLDAGELPNLAGVARASARFDLSAPVAYRSELSWTRFLTGRDPVADRNWAASMTFDPMTYGIATTPANARPPFYAFGPDTKVVTLDLIHGALAEGVDGEQVVAWGAHSPQFPRSSRPAGLLAEIDRRFGPSPVFDNDSFPAWYDPAYLDAVVEGSVTALARRAEIARWLLGRTPDWDLLLLCMSEVHAGGHLLWHGVDPASPLHGVGTSDQAGRRMEEIMRAADVALGRVVEVLPDDTALVVFGLHGAMPADDVLCTVLLPELLYRWHTGRSLLASPDTAAWRAAGCPPVVPPADYRWGDYMVDRFADTARQRARRALHSALPRSAFQLARRAAGRPAAPPLAALSRPIPPEADDVEAALQAFGGPIDYQPAAWYQRHWPAMPSFALPSFGDGHVRLNLVGRERDGLVPVADYDRALDDVVRLLADCRDARTGEPVLDDVLRVRAGDPLDPDGPESDLLVLWRAPADAIEHPELGVIGPFPHARVSHHSDRGFAMVRSPRLVPGFRGSRSTQDLTPTVLELLGRPASGLAGSSLVELV